MTRDEAIGLCRYVHAVCPAQRLDEYTPQGWADILAGLPWTLDEARAAVVAVKRRQPFVDPSEIIAECKRARAVRVDAERREELLALAPARARREGLPDPRPLRAEIDAILARFGLRELTGPTS